MQRLLFIGRTKFFARARARIYRSAAAISICIVFQTPSAIADDSQFIRGQDSIIHAVKVRHDAEAMTREKMRIAVHCNRIKKHAAAAPLIGSEGASVSPRIQSTRGILILEGLQASAEPKILHTALLSPYKNYPISIPGETGSRSGSKYPLALTLAATLAGTGDLVIQKGDAVIIHADGQLYAYSLPEITIPSEGLLRLYLGTDDTLYYDSNLRHPAHSGACRSKQYR